MAEDPSAERQVLGMGRVALRLEASSRIFIFLRIYILRRRAELRWGGRPSAASGRAVAVLSPAPAESQTGAAFGRLKKVRVVGGPEVRVTDCEVVQRHDAHNTISNAHWVEGRVQLSACVLSLWP